MYVVILLLITLCENGLNANKSEQKETNIRQLINLKVNSEDILQNHFLINNHNSIRHFKNTVLGYITPWNSHGYKIAKIFGNKFTHISPVWYEYRNDKLNLIDDKQNMHKKFIKDLRSINPTIKIMPRIHIIDNWNPKTSVTPIVTILEKECIKMKLNGYVFETFIQSENQLKRIHDIAKELKRNGYQTILVIPPRRNNMFFISEKHMVKYDAFAAYSLMTYDYSTPDKPGPNSPLKWIEENIRKLSTEKEQRSKILVGLNMYGYRYMLEGSEPIIGSTYLQFLKENNATLLFDDKSVEHFIHHNEEFIFYPTLYSIKKRIDLATEFGTGLSLWELGQGLDYFYELL